MATASPDIAGDDSITAEERTAALTECLEVFTAIWNERVSKDPGETFDFITLMAHSPAFKDMDPIEYLGNLILLIVGGNDTTRNSISGGVLEIHNNPAEFAKLKADHSLIPNMVSEIIRYQTPLMHMRRLATKDTILGVQHINKGARNHISCGFGIHRCMGNRLAEMQLRIVWEEILKRFERIEVVGEPTRLKSNFVRRITRLPVILHKQVQA